MMLKTQKTRRYSSGGWRGAAMTEAMVIGLIGLAVVLLVVILLRSQPVDVEKLERSLREESVVARREAAESQGLLRQEVTNSLVQLGNQVRGTLESISSVQKDQLDSFSLRLSELTRVLETTLNNLRTSVEGRLQQIQQDNAQQLEKMRQTVDEKLQGMLERRLSESFKLVSERLEQVHQGLGEMQSLAAGVGDLKRVLSNVKARGVWGEWQLEALLEQILSPGQYEKNVATRPGSEERVEFAIRLPGAGGQEDRPVYLPIDAKFPMDMYQRLVEVSETADGEAVREAGRELERRVDGCARDIRDKYIAPPYTTDFAILYLPTEGLYAEVARRVGLLEVIQRNYRVTVAGPTTLAAYLNALQMGFHTLAIQKRSAEVWELLGAVKAEFSKFGEVIGKVQRKLEEASRTIEEEVGRRTRAIERRLREVQSLPGDQGVPLIEDGAAEERGDR